MTQASDTTAGAGWMYHITFNTEGRDATCFWFPPGELRTREDVQAIERHLHEEDGLPHAIITSWRLMQRPDPTPVTVTWHTDDIATLTVGDVEVPLTYDELGTSGMAAAITVVETLAKQFGFTITTEGTPGV